MWIIVCIPKPTHHFFQTFRPIRMFEIVFCDSSLCPKHLSLFCLLCLISANFTKTLVWKTWIRRQIMTSQTTDMKHKWHQTPLNEPPPMKIFCVHHWTIEQCFSTWGTAALWWDIWRLGIKFWKGGLLAVNFIRMNERVLPADMKPTVQTHTFCTTQVDKNRQNKMFYNGVGGWIQRRI